MRLIALAASLLVPVQAFALSCVEPSVDASYATAAQSESTYLVATGTLAFDQSLLPRSAVGLELPPKETRVPATISGKAFLGKGFDQKFDANVELIVRCLGSWCPVIKTGEEHLVFMKEGETVYELEINPCGDSLFTDPTPVMLDQVLACATEGNCSKDPS